MRSADRRKAFFAVCMMAVLLFSHLGVCLWQTQIAQVQNLTAEAGGEAQGILRTSTTCFAGSPSPTAPRWRAATSSPPPFYGGSFNVLSASGQKVFAKGK